MVASGSLPPGVPDDFYQQVANVCADLGAMFLLDTSGGGLKHVNSGVFLLKPSLRELRECVGRELLTEAEQFAAARELDRPRRRAIRPGLAGRRRARCWSRRTARTAFAPVRVPPGSGVGAGDAMVAGVAVGLTRGWPLSQAVRLGIAAGAAMLLTPGTAPCTREDTERLFRPDCAAPVAVTNRRAEEHNGLMAEPFTAPSIVVGVDGSRVAVRAALWALDEALGRDLPLRLVSRRAEDPSRPTAGLRTPAGQRANWPLQLAADAVEADRSAGEGRDRDRRGHADGGPARGVPPAAMICVGAVGLKHFDHAGSAPPRLAGRLGALPGGGGPRADAARRRSRAGWSSNSTRPRTARPVLQFAVEEARLRGAPLRVLGTWQSRYTDVHDAQRWPTATDGARASWTAASNRGSTATPIWTSGRSPSTAAG